MEREKVLTVRDLSITFTTTAGPVHAIRGVNLDLYRGETLAIVGESGSGKSVTVKAAMGILAKNGRVDSGTIVLTLVITEWIGMSRIARAEMLKLKEQEFVLASRTLGAGSIRIIFSAVLPNIIGQIITQLMFSIPTAIFTEAFLSFVGLGIPVPQCSLGSLISDAFNSFTTHPYQIIPPIAVLAILMLSFNMLADGLREAFDPKMKDM